VDKLRALQYFIAAAQERSFSGAARRLEISVPAVLKLIRALEKSLGASLFDRSSQGLALTADGARYLERCHPLLEELLDADESVGEAAAAPRGTVVVGTPAFVPHYCIGSALTRFRARFPDITLDFRVADTMADPDTAGVDVFLLFGWHESPDLIQRRIAQTRYRVLAAPSYWAVHGMPQRPGDLERHQCFVVRGAQGALLDLWEFERGGDIQSVKVGGWLASSQRDVALDAALAGGGVVRINDLLTNADERMGRLVPVLQDWNARHAPPVDLFYRAKHRRTPRIRAFVDFAAEVFRRLEAEREGSPAIPSAERPEYVRKRYGRTSSAVRRRDR